MLVMAATLSRIQANEQFLAFEQFRPVLKRIEIIQGGLQPFVQTPCRRRRARAGMPAATPSWQAMRGSILISDPTLLVINCGSSSVKFALFADEADAPRRLWPGMRSHGPDAPLMAVGVGAAGHA